ncbi:serine/threonine-protein kinase [Enhygromyxa salina]|uniref:non-specific serine/threonine protein kinase n=1 Tax=Enhygromyxa salina TaxID=215803 RepID=A0A2S9YRA1_9BACT|nr:serine/threonine-protein kinase [Enhygromyxa salina]PRQ07625.1 Serine/threonine-protein kinase PknB [Enhygromyxa salina]
MRWIANPGVSPAAPQVAAGTLANAPVERGSTRHRGDLIGDHYRLERPLREAALTQTWEATSVALGRAVAIEFSDPQAHPISDDWLEVARTLARLRHPQIVEIGDFGQLPDGTAYVVMELLVGETVEQLLQRRGCVAWARAVQIIEQVGSALAAAHHEGVLHGDLQPSSVVLIDSGDRSDAVKVVGFHPARAHGGAPAFMSPEQCRGEPPDPRSDVYAIGCLLHALIVGEAPFSGDPERLRWRHLNEAPKALGERAPRQFIPAELEAVARRCLEKQPARRFGDIPELMAELAAVSSFAAAANLAADVIRAPDAAARPMGFAARRHPQVSASPPAAASVAAVPAAAPKPQRASDPPDQRRGPSIGAVVGTALGSVAAIVGVGLGGWWLVTRLIAEPPVGVGEQAEQLAAPADPPASAPRESPSPAIESPAVTEADRAQRGSGTDEIASSDASEPDATDTVSPTKPASAAQTPKVKPKPEPEPNPEPSEKPSLKPDSKANEGIAHDDLVDPWE